MKGVLLQIISNNLTAGRNLIIDIGNTRVKTAVFEAGNISDVHFYSSVAQIPFRNVEKVIYSNVSDQSIAPLYEHYDSSQMMEFTRDLKLPITLNYETPETLGLDRIAGVVGAGRLFPDKNVLSIDLGSCITYDLIDQQNSFQGGVISPGFEMRLKSMHHFTGHLPDLSATWSQYLDRNIGKSTRVCMTKGALEGVIFEIKSQIAAFQNKWGDLTIIMTGGDASIFESRIETPIFVRPNLVLIGLNRILEYNDH